MDKALLQQLPKMDVLLTCPALVEAQSELPYHALKEAARAQLDGLRRGILDGSITALPEAARTAMLASIPMARLGQPEDVARAVAFFASEHAGYITGQVLCVDGGMAV